MSTMISMQCGWCNSVFLKPKKEVDRQNRAGRQMFFCDRSCASFHNNLQDYKLESIRENAKRTFSRFVHDPCHASKAKYGKEKWKYAGIMAMLWTTDLRYMFEFPLLNHEGHVRLYDLCFPDHHLLIEFDGKYHRRSIYFHRDDEKDDLAEYHGFKLVRIPVLENSVIPVSALAGII